jgi:hypothetical protein
MANVPEKREDRVPRPERLTNEQFELVIRRAAELQARAAEGPAAEGLSDEEAIRIGQELGLSGAYLGQALAEVRSGAIEEPGLAARLMGSARFGVARTMPGEASRVSATLERYLVEQEYLVVQRRLADRTVFVRASGVAAAIARTTSELFRRSPLLDAANLEVSVRQVEPDMVSVLLATDLGSQRTGHLVGGSVLGGVGGGVSAMVAAIAIAPPAALVGLPILLAGMGGLRYAYQSTANKVVVQLESLLDRLEHGELTARRR